MERNRRPAKFCWHPLALQQLPPNRLVSVVDHILAGHLTLTPLGLPRTAPETRPKR